MLPIAESLEVENADVRERMNDLEEPQDAHAPHDQILEVGLVSLSCLPLQQV